MSNHSSNLPVNLLILLHLHILSYPYCNAPEYTPEKLFAQTRPLRERTKTMEDIVAFLIQKIEGKSKYKTILHDLYPCLQPSDTVGFRVNATKYLEKLRASCVRGTATSAPTASASNSRTSRLMRATISSAKTDSINKSRKIQPTPSSSQSALSDSHWWWSIVVVRKSLLEECCGDKFERLLLALSTHALYTQIQSASLKNLVNSPKDIPNLLREQPLKYATFLAQAQEKQDKLVRDISDLNLRTQAFVSFRNQLQTTTHPTDISELDIGQLTALQESAYQDVLKIWKYSLRAGSQANAENQASPEDSLEWFLALSSNFPVDNPDIPSKGANSAEPEKSSNASPINLTLPVAAANHPAMLKKLTSLPHIMSIEEISESQRNVPTSSDTFESLPTIQKMLNDSSRDKEILQGLLDAAIQEKKRLEAKLNRVRKDIPPVPGSVPSGDEVKLWMPPEKAEVSKSGQIDRSTLEYLQQAGITGKEETEETIQQRFDENVLTLRESLNPDASSIPDDQLYTGDEEKEIPSHIYEEYDQMDPSLATPRPPKVPVLKAELTDTARRVPMTPRRSTLLPSMLATFSKQGYSQDLLADVSLPDVSVMSVDEQNPDESYDDDVPFEGHSVALRDMLLNAEAYDEGSSNLMDNAILEESDDDFAEL